MAEYQAPEGYLYDPETGLYYSQVTAVDERGSRMQVVTWFHPDTGEYEQQVFPVRTAAKPRKTGTVSKPGPGEASKKLLVFLIPAAVLLLAGIIIVTVVTIRFAAGRARKEADAVKEERSRALGEELREKEEESKPDGAPEEAPEQAPEAKEEADADEAEPAVSDSGQTGEIYTDEEAEETARFLLGHQQAVNFINAGEVYHYEDYFDREGEFWLYRYRFDFDGEGNIVWANGSYLSLEDTIERNTAGRVDESVEGSEVETLNYFMSGEATAGVRFIVKGYRVRLEVDFDTQKTRTFLEEVGESADSDSLFAHIDGGNGEFRTPEEIETLLETAKSEGWDMWWKQ